MPCFICDEHHAVGTLDNFHSAFTIHPGSSYAALVLTAGHFADTALIAYTAFDLLQPVVDAALAEAVAERYAGRWRAVHGQGEAELRVKKGTLWLEQYTLGESNVLQVFGAEKGQPLALREVRPDEFR